MGRRRHRITRRSCSYLAVLSLTIGIVVLILLNLAIVSNTIETKIIGLTGPLPGINSNRCQILKDELGFWSDYQCELWQMIESGASIDMTPYLAENVHPDDRFWSSNLQDNPPGSGRDGRIVYHLHFHKCMGSTVCRWFRHAKPAMAARNSTSLLRPRFRSRTPPKLRAQRANFRSREQTANPDNNCNVPAEWWWNKSEPELHFQNGSYIGATREKMRFVYKQIRRRGWIFVASEGSLENEPIFGKRGPYYYSTILRDPMAWLVSMWHYREKHVGKTLSLDTYLTEHLWGTPNFYTRRLCGEKCVDVHRLTTKHFLQAKSRLDHYDLVMAQDMIEDIESTELILKMEFPSLSFPSLEKNRNIGRYSHTNFTQSQLEYIWNHTLMDKVLYEYAKILHGRKLDSYMNVGT